MGRDGGPEGVGGARGWLAEGRAERPGPAPFWAEKPAERVRLLKIRRWSFRRSCWRSAPVLSAAGGTSRYQESCGAPAPLSGFSVFFCSKMCKDTACGLITGTRFTPPKPQPRGVALPMQRLELQSWAGGIAKSGEFCTEVCDSPDRYLQEKREVWEPGACQKGFLHPHLVSSS